MTVVYCLKFAGVMLSMILADISWTYYFMKVEERSSFSASMWSSLIIVFGMFTTMNYVDDKSLSIAAIIGAFIGTYIAIEMKKTKEKKVINVPEKIVDNLVTE